jgi:hypothetical protein
MGFIEEEFYSYPSRAGYVPGGGPSFIRPGGDEWGVPGMRRYVPHTQQFVS